MIGLHSVDDADGGGCGGGGCWDRGGVLTSCRPLDKLILGTFGLLSEAVRTHNPIAS